MNRVPKDKQHIITSNRKILQLYDAFNNTEIVMLNLANQTPLMSENSTNSLRTCAKSSIYTYEFEIERNLNWNLV